MSVEIITLKSEDDYGVLFDRIEINPPLKTDSEKEKFRQNLFEAQGAVEKALKRKWEFEEDFEVGWDFDYSFFLHGGIYSEKIFCSEYVATVAAALGGVDNCDRWVYHTVYEIEVNTNGETIGDSTEFRGKYYVTNEAAFVLENDMSPCFREMLRKNR